MPSCLSSAYSTAFAHILPRQIFRRPHQPTHQYLPAIEKMNDLQIYANKQRPASIESRNHVAWHSSR